MTGHCYSCQEDKELVADAWSYLEEGWVPMCEDCLFNENPDKIDWYDGPRFRRAEVK